MMDAKTKALKAIANGKCPNASKSGCRATFAVHFCPPCIAREALRGSYRNESVVVELKCERA